MAENKPPTHPTSRRSSLRRASDHSIRTVTSAFQSSLARLDSFFNLDRTGDRGMSDDAESIATELRHLHDAEDELRRELEGIGLTPPGEQKESNETQMRTPPSSNPVPLSIRRQQARRDSGLKKQVSDESFRNLQCQLDDIFHSLDLGANDDSFVGTEATETSNSPGSSDSTPKRRGSRTPRTFEIEIEEEEFTKYHPTTLLERLATAVFGRCEYTVKPALSLAKEPAPCVRAVQGGVVVALAAAIIVSRLHLGSELLPLLLLVVPPSVTWVEVNLPHRREETTIALGVLALHFAISYVK